ncbi:MAG: pyridoxal-dependent decarboxylase [Gemmatimonadota bacterium]
MPNSSLDLDHGTMQRMGRRVADLVAHHLATLRDQPTQQFLTREATLRHATAPSPTAGTSFEELIGTLETEILPYHTREPHPGFVAYVQSCSSFPGIMGDWIASGFNFFAGFWAVAPGPTALEVAVIDWFRTWLGMPAGTGGLLTTGGSAATFTAVVAARHAVVGDDPARILRCVLYCSAQAHSSVVRAAWMAGLPRDHVREIPIDDAFRIRPDVLAEMLNQDRARGLLPMMVVASAGTTNTGAVDPLHAIADLCAEEQVWLHVDGAYGGFAVLTPSGKAALAGIERADSVTLDPHKWLYVPFECGCLLARNPARLSAAFRIVPDYLKDVEQSEAVPGETNFSDYGEQLTRYARAIKVWLAVSYYGTDAIGEAIAGGIRRAEEAEELVRASGGLEVLSPASLGIFCFRAHPRGLDDPERLDALNERINQRVNANARYFISSTRIKGVFSLRICTPGFRTTAEDIRRLIGEIVEAAGE